MDQEFRCEARVTFMGEELHLNKILARFAVEDIMPPRGLVLDPFDLVRVQENAERRRRFIDMVAAEFGHALTEAIFKHVRR